MIQNGWILALVDNATGIPRYFLTSIMEPSQTASFCALERPSIVWALQKALRYSSKQAVEALHQKLAAAQKAYWESLGEMGYTPAYMEVVVEES